MGPRSLRPHAGARAIAAARCYNRVVAAAGSALFRRWAGAGLVVAALVHLATFAPGIAARLPHGLVWVLALVMLGPFAAMVVSIRRRAVVSATPTGRRWRIGLADWRPLLAPVPPGMRLVAVAAIAYVTLNFLLSFVALGDTRAVEERDGRAYRVDGAGARQEIAREERDDLRALQTRLISGHVVLFALLPLIYFVCVEPAVPPRRG